ncbi:MAG: 50S ribosomal protein L11 methyltransferase [Acidobacteria bacterium]|nr:50S ribosomal protein L11 methyltransferase [Acidobacteriota bacterium]
MPYRIDIVDPPPDAVDTLLELGALDIAAEGATLAAILPDSVPAECFAAYRAIISPAVARDCGSVWMLAPRPICIAGLLITPPQDAAPDALRLLDSGAFGSGHHPTTALCVEGIRDALGDEPVNRLLDVGTGSAILALAALRMGVAHATALDIDPSALETAAHNARLNQLENRLQLVAGGVGDISGTWPLVVANILAAPLIEMAPVLARRLSSRGRLILSGITDTLEAEVRQAYRHVGIEHRETRSRQGWVAVCLQTTW